MKQVVSAVLLSLALPAAGAVTYIDASASNTEYETSGALIFQPAAGFNIQVTSTTGNSTDGIWGQRTRSTVNGGSVFVSNGDEDPERLKTTVTLPAAGIYNIYGYIWINGDGTGAWDGSFQLGSGTQTTFDKSNTSNLSATTGHFTTGVLVDDGGQDLMEASLGTWDTSINGLTVTVFIGAPTDPATDGRTWYDGVGYEVVPEPSVAGLAVLALAFGLGRRSRQAVL